MDTIFFLPYITVFFLYIFSETTKDAARNIAVSDTTSYFNISFNDYDVQINDFRKCLCANETYSLENESTLFEIRNESVIFLKPAWNYENCSNFSFRLKNREIKKIVRVAVLCKY